MPHVKYNQLHICCCCLSLIRRQLWATDPWANEHHANDLNRHQTRPPPRPWWWFKHGIWTRLWRFVREPVLWKHFSVGSCFLFTLKCTWFFFFGFSLYIDNLSFNVGFIYYLFVVWCKLEISTADSLFSYTFWVMNLVLFYNLFHMLNSDGK